MKATKEFFESLRTEILADAETPVVDETCVNAEQTTRSLGKRKISFIDLFSGCGGVDVLDAKFTEAIATIEGYFDIYETEIDNLEAELQTLNTEKAAATAELEKQRRDTEEDTQKYRAQTLDEDNYKKLSQELEEYRQREIELRAALDDERKRHEEPDGIERLPISDFIDYAEEHYPADQNTSAKILKEAILDLYDRRRISDEDYERCKLLGTKEIPISSNVTVQAGGLNVGFANSVTK